MRRPVLGGAYSVGLDASVRRERGGSGARVGSSLKPFVDRNGYLRVCPSVHGVPRWTWLHRLVAEAFLGPCPDGMQVNHRDGDKQNNAPSNLEYVTASANMQHAIRLGLRTPAQSSRPGERNGSAKLDATAVSRMRDLRRGGASLTDLARDFGVAKATAHRAVTGANWRSVR